MTLKADPDALVEAAAGWDGVAAEVAQASYALRGHLGRGEAFGFFAQRAGIDAQHDEFIDAMQAALSQGGAVMRELADVLRVTARRFGATDLGVSDTFHDMDGTPR